MLNNTTKAIVFDIGGVLIENPAEDLIRFFAQHFQVRPSRFRTPYLIHFKEWEEGRFNEGQFWSTILKDLEIDGSEILTTHHDFPHSSLWYRAVQDVFETRSSVFNLVLQLKHKGYTVALLSNTETPTTWWFESQGWGQLFHHSFYSCDLNMAKPQEAIYQHVEDKMGVSAQEILFLDDKPENVQAANKFGWQTLLVQTEQDIHRRLIGLLS